MIGMTTEWRAVLLDRVEAGLRSRFGAAVVMARDNVDGGTLRLSVTWPDGGGSFVQLAPNVAHNAISADEAIEVITDSLWRYAPIAGSC